MCPNLVLLSQKIHEVMVLLTSGARGRRGTRASKGVVLLTYWETGNLLGRRKRIHTK